MGTNDIAIKICNSIEEAPDYKTNGQGYKPATIKGAIIVRNGTEGGNDTVDLQFVDEDGNKYIAMVTAEILNSVVVCTNIHKS